MTVKSKARQPRSPKRAYWSNIEELIRRRAYVSYEERGRVGGFALDDRLQAEREVLEAQQQRKMKAAKAT
jgi:hypothetical protein